MVAPARCWQAGLTEGIELVKQLCVHGVAPGELELAAAVLRKQANARLEDVRSVAVHARTWLLLTTMRGATSQGTTSSEELVADVEDALATGSVMMDAVEQVQACIIALSTVSVEVSSACWCDMLSLECTSGHRARMRAPEPERPRAKVTAVCMPSSSWHNCASHSHHSRASEQHGWWWP